MSCRRKLLITVLSQKSRRMARKVWKLIKKPTTTNTDHDSHHQAAAAPNPYSLLNILLRYEHEKKMWLAIGPAQWVAEKAAKELELLKAKEQEAAVVLFNGFKEATKDHHHQVPAVTNESSSSDYSSSSSSFESKVDATKRKLHDTYQQLANAKKRRKIQVIDPCDLPPTQSSSQGAARLKATVVAARKKITTNKKTKNNNNNNNLLTYESTNFYFLKISNRIHASRSCI